MIPKSKIKEQLEHKHRFSIEFSILGLNMYAPFSSRFKHIFVLDCRFNEFKIDEDFRHKSVVDCR